ncbi:MAG: hypothetical protein JWO19_3937 [Bryobacterales bacterium]|jgi:hypothetical protein|nr:hypothetical protein [Bryobacterales bacterium]
MKHFLPVIFSLVCLSGLAVAQTSAPPASQSNQLTPRVLAEMLQSASNFHDLVQNLNKGLGPDVHVIGPDGVTRHSLERTAVTMGAGAGVGVAIGSMTRNPNGALIGALVGSAGGLVLDEVLKHREQTHAQVLDPQKTPKDPPVLKRRTH